MKKQFPFILLLIITCQAFGQKTLDKLLKKYNTEEIPYISVTELRMHQLKNEVLILDSREITECNVSKIPNAQYIGYDFFSIEDFLQKNIAKNQEIVVYCSLGIRSETIAKKIKEAGYTNVKNLYGGIFEWKNKGYPVIDSTNTITENVHTFSEEWSKWLLKGTKIID